MLARPLPPWSLGAQVIAALVAVVLGPTGCASTGPATQEVAMNATALPTPAEHAETHLWGYQGPDGSWELPPVYTLALEFTPGGIAAVSDREGWRFVDRTGRVVVAKPWLVDNFPDPFHEGLARAVDEGTFVFFDERGDVALRTRYAYAEPFSLGLALVCAGCRPERVGEQVHWVGGPWGFIDKTGREVIPCRYDEGTSFDEGTARVKQRGEWVTIDRAGRTVPQ